MAKSSIHFQGIKSNSTGHNKRLNQNLDYVFDDLSSENVEFFFSDQIGEKVSNAQHIEFLKNLVKEKTGRKAQTNAHMMQEGVFNFNENHPDKFIANAISQYCNEMNIKPVRLFIHRDEGHLLEDGTRKLNLHAHITVEWIDRNNGKSHKWTKEEASRSQTVLANCLGMERGKESTKKHLNALDYKLKVREEELHNIQVEKLQALESQKKILTNSVDFSVYKNLGFERNNLVLKILSECKEKEIFNYPQIFQKINPQLWNEILQLNTKMLEEEKNQLKERNDRKINLERMNERVSSQQTEVKKAETEVKKFTVAAEPLKPAPRKKGPRL